MKRSLMALVTMLAALNLFAAAVSVSAVEIKVGNHKFTLPDGFEIERVAGPPLVDRPISADFDEQGRLYVTDSSGTNDKVDKQLAEKPHRIVRLEDTDGDGVFDKSVVFADKMMFPEGAMWLDGSLYVAAPPSIWKLTDNNGDGIADVREEWFKGKTLGHCANDLHGPYAGPDGWIYWCKGAWAEQTYERPGKPPFVTKASHIFRCRPDGSGIEPVMTGGMDNPVGLVFTAGGERIFSTTFLQHPANGRRDGLLHAVYGGVHGKIHDVIESHPRTGDILPVLSHLGAAAPCGLGRYESTVFGDEYRDNLLTCCFNMRKITRHVLEPDGGTFKSTDSDFLVSDNLDFHPTDVKEDADGSLIVVDTGGWYKLCCPTSQFHKPDVLGAIYRVKRTGAKKLGDPRGAKLAWNKMEPDGLARLLGDGRLAVRRRAVAELARRGEAAVPVLSRIAVGTVGRTTSPQFANPGAERVIRENALWALCRIDRPEARAIARRAMQNSEGSVWQVAAYSASLWRDPEAASLLATQLQSGTPQQVRLAAETLGRVEYKWAVPELLAATGPLDGRPDRFLEHSLIFALIEIADRDQTAQGLKVPNSSTRRVALIALDQMPNGGLKPETVAPLLGSEEPVIRETAAWIVGRHPEWGDALAGYLKTRLGGTALTLAEGLELEQQLARFAKAASIQELLAETIENSKWIASRQIALRAVARSALKETPPKWIAALTQTIGAADPALVDQAIQAARALPPQKTPDAKLIAALLAVAGKNEIPAGVRLGALATVPGGLTEVPPATFDFLRGLLRPEQEVLVRSSAADVLARSKLTTAQLALLTDVFKAAGPLEADRLLPAFKESTDEAVGLKLVAAIKDSPALAGLRIDALKTNLAKFPPLVQERAAELYQIINADAGKQKEKLESLLAALKPGDIRRGQVVFHTSKAACAACHPFGYLGGNTGPDLTKIGQVRTERDLLEAIVFPSASFVRSFEPVIVVTNAGKSYNGLVRKDTPEEVVLATGPKEEVRIARDDIEEIRPGTVSIMPSGLDQQLSSQDLADLIAYLKAAK